MTINITLSVGSTEHMWALVRIIYFLPLTLSDSYSSFHECHCPDSKLPSIVNLLTTFQGKKMNFCFKLYNNCKTDPQNIKM